MPRWVLFAVVSAGFAGVTSVVAKFGLRGISGEAGLLIRTFFVAVFVLGLTGWGIGEQIKNTNLQNWIWLIVSAATTACSWYFYYRALKEGEVSTVALIDKGSFVVTVFLAVFFLQEMFTWRLFFSCLLVLSGLFLAIWKK
jgi:transporter family protein